MSDTPETDKHLHDCFEKDEQGGGWWNYSNMKPKDGGDWVPADFARELERENAALRAQDAWLVATFGNLEDENQKLRAELEAQAVVNGKGGEREAKLLSIISRIRRLIDQELDWSQAQRLEKAGELCDEVLGKAEQP